MPTTRRSTGGGRARAGPERGQSTISFASRVTKSVPKDAKKAALSDPPKQATVKATPPPKDEAEETPAEETPAEEASADEAEPVPDVTPDEEKSAAELRAEEVSDRDIAGYWAGVESGRIAPRAHQGDVTLSEKVLRYFDVSSQYGVSSAAPWRAAAGLVLTRICSPRSESTARSAGCAPTSWGSTRR